MKLSTWFIDTFTSTPFKGNPSWVCLIEEELSSDVMQSIANELNCPVTAFIKKKPGTNNSFDIRYFTPITEITACGHGTLASAKFVVHQQSAGNAFVFHTVNEVAIRTVMNEDGTIMMTYPAYKLEDWVVDDRLVAALGLGNYKTVGYSQDLETLFIELESVEALRTIQPDYQKMVASNDEIKEVVITCASNTPEFDYYLRSFCPWIGIDEDPVTGSVHGVLGNFWKKRVHKEKMSAHQASPRGGNLVIRAFDDRVEIGGSAVILLKGEMNL